MGLRVKAQNIPNENTAIIKKILLFSDEFSRKKYSKTETKDITK